MGSLPESGYQISCLGVGRDEAHSKEISNIASRIVTELARDFDFELASLDGITFASDYANALNDLDRGFPFRRPLTATDAPHAQGVAMTPTVVRDGKIRFRIVASAWVGIGLTDENEELHRQALYTLCHEAAHVHHESKWYKAFPEKHGTPIEEPGKIGSILSAMFSSFAEYAVCRSTAAIRPECASEYETGVVGALDHTFSMRTTRMRAYLLHRNHQQILDEMAPLFGEFLKLTAYLLGHLDGLDATMEEQAPTAFERIQQYPVLQSALEDFHRELNVLWQTEGNWPGFDVYYPLHECALRLIAAYSITIKPSGTQFNISVPLPVIEQFIDMEWVLQHAQELAAFQQS
jgi:hypothetical protein